MQLLPEQIEEMARQEWSTNGNNIYHACHTIANKTSMPAHQVMAMVKNQNAAGQSILDTLKPENWPRMQTDVLDGDPLAIKPKIIKTKTVLGDISMAISNTIQFPENTIYAHSLGITASAMCRNFTYRIDSKYSKSKDNPVSLFVVGAQPSGTGKSGVNEFLTAEIERVHDTIINPQRRLEAYRLKKQIEELESEIKKNPTSSVIEKKEIELLDYKRKLPSLGEIKPNITDATPEGIENAAIRQGGVVNITSAEAESVNVAIGGLYSDKGKSNMGVILSLWDNEKISVERISREAYSGRVRGCFSVIAQDNVVKDALEAGLSGRGISERFLIIRESTYMGGRHHKRKRPIDLKALESYNTMIRNVLTSDEVELIISDECHELVLDYMDEQEPKLAGSGEYSDNMLRGVIGKAEKQILRIACVLHVSEEWKKQKSRNKTVSIDAVVRAIYTFKEFIKGYLYATNEHGMAGDSARLQEMVKALSKEKERLQKKHRNNISAGLKTTVREIRTGTVINSKKSIIGSRGDATQVIKDCLPDLVILGFCAYDGKHITINPNL